MFRFPVALVRGESTAEGLTLPRRTGTGVMSSKGHSASLVRLRVAKITHIGAYRVSFATHEAPQQAVTAPVTSLRDRFRVLM